MNWFYELHLAGGPNFMIPLTIILLLNIALIVYVAYFNMNKRTIHTKWLETIKQLGGFALAWGAFSTLIGLFQAFNYLEASKEVIPFQVIMGGLKVALLTSLYGFAIFHLSFFAVIILRLTKKETGE